MRTGLWIVALALALGGCNKKSEEQGGGAPPAQPAGGAAVEKAAALKAAWEADANCLSLAKCCTEIVGTGFEQTIGPLCEQVKTFQDFEQQAENLVDPAWQSTTCKNTLEAVGMMGNASNPVPASCAPAAAP